jgi:hypothetical protein
LTFGEAEISRLTFVSAHLFSKKEFGSAERERWPTFAQSLREFVQSRRLEESYEFLKRVIGPCRPFWFCGVGFPFSQNFSEIALFSDISLRQFYVRMSSRRFFAKDSAGILPEISREARLFATNLFLKSSAGYSTNLRVHSAVFLKTNQTRRIRFHGKVRS